MKLRTKIMLSMLAFFTLSNAANAAFPQDFSDVVFIESPSVKGWPVTASMSVSVGGGNITMDYNKKGSWPRSARLGSCCVASAWGFVKVGGVWHAGTWEYLRPNQITKKASAYGGCCHFRSPINNFNKVNGEIYGFMVSGVARDTLFQNNVTERSNVVLYRWGSGVVFSGPATGEPEPEPEPEAPPVVAPIIDAVLN